MNNKMEETIPKTVGDEGLMAEAANSVRSPDDLIARPELGHVLSRTIFVGSAPYTIECDNVGRLRQRIRYLESVVQEQNEALLRYESRDRTYGATLRLLETTKTENEALQYDRDRIYTENEFNKDQAQKLSQELERNKERQNEFNERYLQARQDSNEKIVKLKNELERWKRKYESVVHRGENVGHTEQTIGLGHTEQATGLGNTEPSHNEHAGEIEGHTEQAVGLGHTEPSQARELESHTEQAVGLGHTEPSQDRELECHIKQAVGLGHTELSQAGELRGVTDASHVADSMSPVRKRKCTFLKMKTRLPCCKNCMTVFDKLKPYQVECRFHRSFPQPLKAWQHEFEDNNTHMSGTLGYKFWPCCGKISIKVPPGCLKLKQHDLTYPGLEEN